MLFRSAAGTTTTPGAWVSGNIAVFSAGTDATGGYTVTLSGTQTIGGLTVEEGIPTISGGTALAINAASTPFNITGTATISSSITGATFGIAKSGSGTLNLNGVIGTTTGGLSISRHAGGRQRGEHVHRQYCGDRWRVADDLGH